jgi:hypothetical protein
MGCSKDIGNRELGNTIVQDMIILHHERRKATLPELILSSHRKIALPDIHPCINFFLIVIPTIRTIQPNQQLSRPHYLNVSNSLVTIPLTTLT